jgi:hypothetical protein
VLDVHGWGDMQPHFTRLSKQGDWQKMTEMVDDEMLNAFVLICENPDDIPQQLEQRYGGLVDSWMCTYIGQDSQQQQRIINEIQAAQ